MPDPHLLLNALGWLLFGAAMTIGWLDLHPWPVQLATTPVYVLLGFLVSLPLGHLYDRLGVGRLSFGRTLAIIVLASYAAGVAWIALFWCYRFLGPAEAVFKLIVGPTAWLRFPPEWIFDGAFSDGALPVPA